MKFSLQTQIAEIEREVEQRKSVYARLVSAGKMRQSEMDYKIDCMQAVGATLEWLLDNEPAVREYAAKKKTAEAQQ